MKKVSFLIFVGCVTAIVWGCATVSAPEEDFLVPGLFPRPQTVPAQGDGIFGKWITDSFGLPAYEYTMDQHVDPRAVWDPKLAPKTTRMWFPIGNQRIVATAFNHGFVQLFYFEADPRWINYYEPELNNFTGGFGFVQEGSDVFTTLYSRRPPQAKYKRIYGMGYFEKIVTYSNLCIDQCIYAPQGDLPVLISEVNLKNLSEHRRTLKYYEYWDVNMQEVSVLLKHPLLGRVWKRSYGLTPRYLPDHKMLVIEGNKVWGKEGGFPDKPRDHDPEPPAVFLAALCGEPAGYEYDQGRIFCRDSGWIKDPIALEAITRRPVGDRLNNNADYCLVLSREVTLEPGEDYTLKFAFGYAKAEKPQAILAKLLQTRDSFEKTMSAWKAELPIFQGPPDNYLSREVKWNYYCLNALGLIDGYNNTPFVPQGGNYLYTWGLRGATRDLSSYAQTFSYYNPQMARNQIRLILRGQSSHGRFFYGMSGYGSMHQWYYRPSDFGLWVIQALTEYVFATRDFAFLDEQLPYYPKEKGIQASVYEHAEMAFLHLMNKVGTGRHGLVRLRLSDWNDEMTFLVARNKIFDTLVTFHLGESTLNTAMACAILPRFAKLAEIHGDDETACKARKWTEALLPALKAQWREQGWLNRAYSGLGNELGDSELYLEPQIWALLAGNVLNEEQTQRLINNMRTALMNPSALGMLISNKYDGSKTTRPGEQEQGGIWFAMNSPAVVAMAQYDPDLAYQELIKNSLSWHADTYPALWMGIWSGPDSFNSVFSSRPGQSWYQNTPFGGIGPQEFPVMNAHSHAQMLYALARLAGLNANVDSYTIDPKIPADEFSFQSRTVGVNRTKDRLQGFFVFESDGELQINVKNPPALPNDGFRVLVNNQPVQFRVEEDFVTFRLMFQKKVPVRWEVSVINRGS